MGQVDLTRMKPASRGSPELWRVGSGRVRRISKPRGLGRVGSGGFQNLAGRAGSGQDVSKFSWVGSGRVGSRRLEILTGRVVSVDPYENTWKCGEPKLCFSPSAGG